VRHRLAVAVVVLALVLSSTPVRAESPLDRARSLLGAYHQDLTRIDQARDLLEAELGRERKVETLVLLSRISFLLGDVRAVTVDEKLAAYARGRELGQRAVELAPRNEEAHVWYAINTGRWGQAKGVMRSLFLLPTLREELDIIFSLNPRSIRGHALAGNVFFEVPALLGGDRKKAEEHYRKALEIDPQFTVVRIDLARLLIASGRPAEARRELTRVIGETAPSDVAGWTVKDRPRARQLLDSIKDRK
jgi:tetratricopeptide (TPR) repeat protein